MAEDHAKQFGRESIDGERERDVSAPSQLHNGSLCVPLQFVELFPCKYSVRTLFTGVGHRSPIQFHP